MSTLPTLPSTTALVHIFDSIEEAEAAGFVVPRWQKDGETLVATFHNTLD